MILSLFGKQFEIGSAKDHLKAKASVENLKRQVELLVVDKAAPERQWNPTSMRPAQDTPYIPTERGAQVPLYPQPVISLYYMVKNVDALRIPIDVLNHEYHRNGFEVVPKYRYKCRKCKKEYQNKPVKLKNLDQEVEQPQMQGQMAQQQSAPNIHGDSQAVAQQLQKPVSKAETHTGDELECDVCKGKKFDEPDYKNRQKLVNLLEKYINNNHQTLVHVSKQLARDLDIADMAYLAVLKKYVKGSNGKLRRSYVTEIIRLTPAQTFLLANREGHIGVDKNGNEIYFCPQHRHNGTLLRSKSGVPKCTKCGYECIRAAVEVTSQYMATVPDSKSTLYGMSEVIMCHGKYWPSLTYGYSPIFTLWTKALALSFMDEYVKKYFDKQRPPKNLLIIGSRNWSTLQKSFDNMKERLKEDPYGLNPLLVETDRGGKSMVEYVDLTGSLQDLQFIEVREEFKRMIGAMYGVTGLYENAEATGWSQEGLQMAVTNRAVKYGQDILLKDFYEPLCRMVGIYDWIVKLKAGEEMDELRDEQLQAQKIQNAAAMHQMGFKVEMDANNDFVFSRQPQEMAPGMPGQGMPGQGGGQGKMPTADKESMTEYGGMPDPRNRPTDDGGKAEGFPAAGPKTSQSKKSYNVKVGNKNVKVTPVED